MKLLFHSPVGLLFADYDSEVLRSLRFWRVGEHPPAGTRDAPSRDDLMGQRIQRELAEYFAGARREFDLPLQPAATPFQQTVRDALRRIPYGEVRTYGELARELDRAGAARAIGQSNAANPYPILVPCHRVVASGGKLGGYMGDWGEGEGVAIKRWLLGLEGKSLELRP